MGILGRMWGYMVRRYVGEFGGLERWNVGQCGGNVVGEFGGNVVEYSGNVGGICVECGDQHC